VQDQRRRQQPHHQLRLRLLPGETLALTLEKRKELITALRDLILDVARAESESQLRQGDDDDD